MDQYASKAARILLNGTAGAGSQALSELVGTLRQDHGLACPECKSICVSDNGLRGHELAFRCDACLHEWPADPT